VGVSLDAISTAFRYEWHLQFNWMWVNFVLAVVPGIGALVLRHWWRWLPGARWVLFVGVALLLPNAPYVVTDLVHLHTWAELAPSRLDLWAGVLPLVGLLIASGVLSYGYTMHALRSAMRAKGWTRRARLLSEALVDVLCAVGVALGRISRLNSWDVLQPGRVAHGLETLVLDPRAVVLALIIVVLADLAVDWVASGAAHSVQARLRQR